MFALGVRIHVCIYYNKGSKLAGDLYFTETGKLYSPYAADRIYCKTYSAHLFEFQLYALFFSQEEMKLLQLCDIVLMTGRQHLYIYQWFTCKAIYNTIITNYWRKTGFAQKMARKIR